MGTLQLLTLLLLLLLLRRRRPSDAAQCVPRLEGQRRGPELVV
jgi:hypothetical protein